MESEDKLKNYYALSFGAHPEYTTGDKFVLLYYSASCSPGEILTLHTNYNTPISDFSDEKGRIITTFWSRVAPYRGEAGMTKEQFDKLQKDFAKYNELISTAEAVARLIPYYYSSDTSNYGRAKKIVESVSARAERLKQQIMETRL